MEVPMRAPSPNIDGMGSLLYPDGTARFRVWAPNASTVQVFGDFTGGSSAMALDLAAEPGTGNWSADQIPVSANDKYQYIITNPGGVNNIAGTFYRTDARAQQVQSSNAASQGYVIDPAIFTTNRQPFTTPAFQDFLIYQLHVGSFAGKNDGIPVTNYIATFVDIIAKLDYIHGLGFNAIELLPITDFLCDLPGASLGIGADEGYGPCDLFASEDAYATSPGLAVAQLIQLIDAAHSKGLAVILDVVYNHASQPDNRYWQYDGNDEGYNLDGNGNRILGGIYFVKGFHTPWGEGFALWQQEVKDLLLDNARMYLRDFRVDGLRFDAVQAIQPDALEYVVPALRSTFPDKYLIAEYNPTDPVTSVMPDIDPWGVFQFCAIWDMSSCCWDSIDMLNGAGPGGIVNNQRLFSDPNTWHHVMYLTGSHDQIYSGQGDSGLYFTARFGGRTNGWALAKARLAWSLNATLPATPMLFMGTEGHIDGSWNPVVGPWGDFRLDWDRIGDPTGAPMQQLVRDVNTLRWDHSALRSPYGFVTHNDTQNQIVAFKRYDLNGDVLLIVVNPGDGIWGSNQYGVSLAGDGGTWLEIFNSQAPVYGGINTVGNYQMYLEASNGQIWINLPSWSMLIFARQ
jgi:1,4-alpha-glucan branching enzyme